MFLLVWSFLLGSQHKLRNSEISGCAVYGTWHAVECWMVVAEVFSHFHCFFAVQEWRLSCSEYLHLFQKRVSVETIPHHNSSGFLLIALTVQCLQPCKKALVALRGRFFQAPLTNCRHSQLRLCSVYYSATAILLFVTERRKIKCYCRN